MQQAAKATGIAVMTLHRWVTAKRLKAPKLRIRSGRAVRLWGEADLARLRSVKQATFIKVRRMRRMGRITPNFIYVGPGLRLPGFQAQTRIERGEK